MRASGRKPRLRFESEWTGLPPPGSEENFLRPGRDVAFAKDTRMEIETTPLRAPVLKPTLQ